MRIARSTSPRRRKRLPRANCSSTVWGFSLATCRNDSMALSGCSFSRKFRPRKYEVGIARDSDRSDLMSMRAATQPMPKNSGRASNHQISNSMDVRSGRLLRWQDGVARRGERGGTLEPPDLAPLAHDRRDPGEEPDDHAGDEDHEEHEHERRLPDLPRQAVDFDLLRVLDREPDEDEDDEEAEDPDEGLHGGRYCKAFQV